MIIRILKMFGPGLASFLSRRITWHRKTSNLASGLLVRFPLQYNVRPYEKWLHQKICHSHYKKHLLSKLQETQIQNLFVSYKLCSRNIYTEIKDFTVHIKGENQYFFTLLAGLPQYQQTLTHSKEASQMIDEERFQELLHSSHADKPANEVLAAFRVVSDYNKESKQDISNVIFNDISDSLSIKFKDMNNEELIKSLYCLSLWPRTTDDAHNFKMMWTQLDTECCKRLSSWDIQTMILVGNLWHRLHLSRITCYHWELTRRLYKKLKKLTPAEYVQYMFFLNLCRRREYSISCFELGDKLDKIINELSLEELSVVALGFFKTKTPMQNKNLIGKVVAKLLPNIKSVSNEALCALLKVIRLSVNSAHTDLVYKLQDSLLSEVPRLNNPTAVQAILVGTKNHVFHEMLIKSVAEKYVKDLSHLRLKELERFIQTLVFYNYDPHTKPCVYEAVEQELKAPHRKEEINKYMWSFVTCVHCLAYRGRFQQELIKHIFDVLHVKGQMKVRKAQCDVQRIIASLSYTIELEFPEFTGNNMSPELRRKIAKIFRGTVPFPGMNKINLTQNQIVEIANIASKALGQEDLCYICHLLPHFHSPDVVFCLGEDNCPVPIPQEFKSQLDVKYPLHQHGRWYCVIYAGSNTLIKNTKQLCGHLMFKIRQLRKIGYIVTVIPCIDFAKLHDEEKEDYIEGIIKKLIRNK